MEKERRKHPRFPLFGVAEIRPNDRDRKLFTALIRDVSEAGAGLYAYDRVEVGHDLSITLKFTDDQGNRIAESLTGKVASVLKQRGFYRMGIVFDMLLNAETQPQLHKHLRDVLRRRE